MSDEMCPRGRPAETSIEDIVKAAQSIEEPVFKAGEIAERVEVGTARVRDYLDEMHADGIVRCKSVGSGKVWWLELH
mgnify:CR=1 FL=1